MRLREWGAVVMAILLTATACSRLTFVKPDAQRRGAERVAEDYSFKETDASKRRSEARRRAAAASQALQAGRVEAAAAEARAALKADSTLPEPHTAMAMVAMRQGDDARAGTHYGEAAKRGPSGATYNNYGAWLCGHGRPAESLAWFDRAVRDPNYADRSGALANAGSCAASAGEYDRVERDLRAALEGDARNPVALAALAGQLFREGRYLEARAFSERRLAAAPPSAATLELASRIEEKLGDSTAAARYVQRLRAEFPQSANALPTGESSTP